MEANNSKLMALLLESDMPAMPVIARAFNDMGIAEAVREEFEIEVRTPLDCWLACIRPPELVGRPDWLYEAHCRELFARGFEGKSLDDGTLAEILVACSEASMNAPFNALGHWLCWRAMSEVSPERAGQLWPEGQRPSEKYPGEGEEALAELRRKLRRQRVPKGD
jgi:hypothetical protein